MEPYFAFRQVCEETMAEHKERLAELQGLVAQIASDVGLDASGPLHCEVEALGQRLEDIRETLSCLADAAHARALNQELARGDLCQTKSFLDSVQQASELRNSSFLFLSFLFLSFPSSKNAAYFNQGHLVFPFPISR